MTDKVRAQVIIPKDSGVPADAITNTWHFQGLDSPTAVPETIVGMLAEFYNDDVANNFSVGDLLSSKLNGSAARIKLYDLDNGEPVGAPIYDEPFAVTTSVNDAMADELAICLSYQAAPATGVKQARRRGRIYLGPLSTTVLDPSGAFTHIDTFAGQIIAGAGVRLKENTLGGVQWSVFSAKDYVDSHGVVHPKKPPQPADHWYPVDNVWVDNAFDVQRSRGPKASTRWTGGPA